MNAPSYVRGYFRDNTNYDSDTLFGTGAFLVLKEAMNEDNLNFVQLAQSDEENFMPGYLGSIDLEDVWNRAVEGALFDEPLTDGVEGTLGAHQAIRFDYDPPVYLNTKILKVIRWLMGRTKEIILYPSPSQTVIAADKRIPSVAIANARTPEKIEAIIAPIDPREGEDYFREGKPEPKKKNPVPPYVLKSFMQELVLTDQVLSDRYVALLRQNNNDRMQVFLDYVAAHENEFEKSQYDAKHVNQTVQNLIASLDYDTPLKWDKNEIVKYHGHNTLVLYYNDRVVHIQEKHMKNLYWFVGGKRTPLVAYTNKDGSAIGVALENAPNTIVAVIMAMMG